jgi:hypothetical protein
VRSQARVNGTLIRAFSRKKIDVATITAARRGRL